MLRASARDHLRAGSAPQCGAANQFGRMRTRLQGPLVTRCWSGLRGERRIPLGHDAVGRSSTRPPVLDRRSGEGGPRRSSAAASLTKTRRSSSPSAASTALGQPRSAITAAASATLRSSSAAEAFTLTRRSGPHISLSRATSTRPISCRLGRRFGTHQAALNGRNHPTSRRPCVIAAVPVERSIRSSFVVSGELGTLSS